MKIVDSFLEWYPSVFAQKKYIKLNHFLIDLGLRGMGVLNHKESVSGEQNLIEYIVRNYEIDVVFDVGANQGNYASRFSNLPCEVYCFEPNPKTFDKLKSNLGAQSNVKMFNFGMSENPGHTLIYDHVNSTGSEISSIYKEVITDIHKFEAEEVEVELQTIDDFIDQKGISNINLLKIDTEGNEMKVLKGAQKLLNENRVDIVHFEFNEMNTVSRIFLRDFSNLLRSFNFYRLLPKGFIPIDFGRKPYRYELFAFQNVVAFRKDMDKLA